MHEAIKTEYKGVVFDSKSEAVFARTLHLAGVGWIPHVECNGHVWDFAAYGARQFGGKQSRILIEYKPSMPTNTYIDNLTEKMSAAPCESIVVWGNPWDGVDKKIDGPKECCYRVYPIYSSYAKFGWGDFIRLGDNGGDWPTSWRHDTYGVLGITEAMAQEAKRYRFDLVA